MKSTKWKGVSLGLVAGLIAATGVLGTNALTASGQATPTPVPVVVGKIVLTVPGGEGRTGTVELFETGNDSAIAVQEISAASACDTITNRGVISLDISTTPNGTSNPVLPNDGLGVLTSGQNCGTAGVISGSPTEAMLLKLNDSVDDHFEADVYVTQTDLVVFRPDSQGRRLSVNADGTQVFRDLSDGLNGINPKITITEDFKTQLAVSSTSTRFNKGINLRGATFTLVKDVIPNQPPVADFEFNINLLDGTFVDKSSDFENDIESYSWDFNGDGAVDSTQKVPSLYSYEDAGEYTARLTVTDGGGLSSTAEKLVEVKFAEAVDCSTAYNPDPANNGGAALTATFLRAENGIAVGKAGACEEIGVDVLIEEEEVFWDNATTGVLGGAQDVQALFTLEWAGVPASNPAALQRYINYQGSKTGAFFPVQWCTSFTKDDSQDLDGDGTNEVVLTAVLPQGPIAVQDGVSGFDTGRVNVTDLVTNDPRFVYGEVPWCLVDNSEVLDGGEIFQTQILYGSGDPRM